MDSYRLANAGLILDIGSYVQANPGPDFDFAAVYQAQFSQNQVADGGVLAYETNSPRIFKFPLMLASSGAFSGGLNGLEQLVRSLAKPGGVVDLQPEGVASADAVRFDIIDGRYDPDYSIYVQRLARRSGVLALTVQPFGYWPTWITLASVASVALPGVVSIPNASILGDVPGLARIVVQPSSATQYAAGTWLTDMVAWGLGGRASFSAFVSGGALLSGGVVAASIAGNKYAPASQSFELFPSPTLANWTQLANISVASLIEPAYRGRFRAFAYARLAEPSGLPWRMSVDAVGGLQTGRALASAAPVATVAQDGYSSVISASPAFQLIDLGELVLPQTASGQDQTLSVRLWGAPGTSNLGIATPWLSVGGLYLLPVDGGAGVLPRGLGQPTSLTPSVGRFALDAYARSVLIVGNSADLATPMTPLANGLAFYQGDFPRVVASTIQLDVIGAARKAASGATAPLAAQAPLYASVSVSYQPRFTFLRSI